MPSQESLSIGEISNKFDMLQAGKEEPILKHYLNLAPDPRKINDNLAHGMHHFDFQLRWITTGNIWRSFCFYKLTYNVVYSYNLSWLANRILFFAALF